MRAFISLTLTLGLGAVPAALPAQTAGQEGDEIVVTGPPTSAEAIPNFVESVGARTVEGHVARWNSAVCPQVTGLREELNNYIAQTVTAIADAVGARAGGEGCDPNLVVVFMAQPSQFVQTLREQRPAHLATLDLREREAIASSGAPARSWAVSELRTRDGRLVRQLGSPTLDTNFEQGGSRGVASRISNELRADFSTVYLLIDLDQLAGVTMQQLSAFAAMTALTAAGVDEPISPARTILNLFHQRDAAPADITDWDIAYLRGLYRVDPAQRAELQRSAIAGHMRELLQPAPGD
ncbi:MAG: hypothetical protein ABR601_03680 [Parasphingopyxis sp.]|nr:hypothetical protein [Sphingomonadales bacterium]